MGWLSFLKRKDKPASKPAAPAELVAQARAKARQRLIGAVVLLGVGIIGFPLLFETQPRPISVDVPIEIPRKDNVAPLQMPPARPAAPASQVAHAPMLTEPAEEPKASALAPKPQAPAPKVEAPKAETPAAKNETPAPVAKASPAPADAARAQALLDAKPVDEGRFVVQVGAFAENAAARETRGKLEKLGFKTYTQVVETSAGKRIRVRVGPFASREQAAQAAEKIKAAGLNSQVLTL